MGRPAKISDLDILKELRKNARVSYRELAKKFGVSDTAIRKRIKKLEQMGVIKKYTIEIDPKLLGYGVITIIGIDTKPEHYVSILEKLKTIDEVISLYSTSGDHMIMIECWFKTYDEFTKFVKMLEQMEGVTRVCPAIIIEKIK